MLTEENKRFFQNFSDFFDHDRFLSLFCQGLSAIILSIKTIPKEDTLMKAEIRKIIAMILLVVFCATAAITGIAVSAASHTNAASTATPDRADNSKPALKDGVWQAVYEDGKQELFFINSEDSSFSLIDPEYGIGVPSRFEYDSSTGIYKMQIAYEGNEERWRVIDNSDSAATVSNAQGDLITLYYLSNDTVDSFKYFTLYELCEMAKADYTANGGNDNVVFSGKMIADGSLFAKITGEKDGKTVISYTVDMISATGTDGDNNRVDLSGYSVKQ